MWLWVEGFTEEGLLVRTEAVLESSLRQSGSAGEVKLVRVGLEHRCHYSSIALKSKCSQREFKRCKETESCDLGSDFSGCFWNLHHVLIAAVCPHISSASLVLCGSADIRVAPPLLCSDGAGGDSPLQDCGRSCVSDWPGPTAKSVYPSWGFLLAKCLDTPRAGCC